MGIKFDLKRVAKTLQLIISGDLWRRRCWVWTKEVEWHDWFFIFTRIRQAGFSLATQFAMTGDAWERTCQNKIEIGRKRKKPRLGKRDFWIRAGGNPPFALMEKTWICCCVSTLLSIMAIESGRIQIRQTCQIGVENTSCFSFCLMSFVSYTTRCELAEDSDIVFRLFWKKQ